MICMLQLAPLLGRERDDPTALFFALAVLLAANPYSAAHVGLQLSFAAVAGLQLAAQPIQSGILRCFRLDRPARLAPLRWLLALPRGGVGVLSATLAASVFTVPLVAVHFQSFVLIAPLANLLALWAVSVLFTGGLCTGVLGIFAPGAASAAGDVLAVLARYFYWVVEEMAGIPFAAVRLDSVYHALWLGYLCVLVGAALIVPGRKRPWIPVGLGSAGLALAVFLSGLAFQSGVMTTAVLDVGQGQSVLLQSGEYLVLVDCGGDRSENAGDIAADYIQSLGHTQLDLLVVSHYHADHANGIGRLLKRMDVTALALPDVEQDDPLRREILQLAQEREVPVHFIREDTLFSGGGEENFTVYAPMTDGEDTNEIGLTVLASAGEFDVLITGDMGEQTELELLSSKELPDLEILVVGHHGSRYSTSRQLLAALKPETAVISVGGSNTYGHPAQETLERLERAGCGVYRTDKQGTVVIRIDE